jgi:hypothetical protein
MRVMTLLCWCLLSLASPLHAQESLLGQHKINLRLKPLPAAEVLNVLSTRSKGVGQVETPSAEWGRPWKVEGADQLQGIVVTVNFVATPVEQVVATTLGCVGFAYSEHGDHIVIEKSEHVLPPDQCKSVTRVAAAGLASAPEPAPERQYSWHLQSISALEFIKMFANESRLNIIWPYRQTELLGNIRLRVDVSDMRQDDVLKNVLGCIGWEFERTNADVSAFRSATPRREGECQGFSVL